MSGLKSAWELALERMEQSGEAPRTLTDEQKKALADIDRAAEAGVAELEIVLGAELAAARAAGDVEKAEELERRRADEKRRIRERAERDKRDIAP